MAGIRNRGKRAVVSLSCSCFKRNSKTNYGFGCFSKRTEAGRGAGGGCFDPSAPFPLHKRRRRLKKGRNTTINFPCARARGDESLAGIITGEGARARAGGLTLPPALLMRRLPPFSSLEGRLWCSRPGWGRCARRLAFGAGCTRAMRGRSGMRGRARPHRRPTPRRPLAVPSKAANVPRCVLLSRSSFFKLSGSVSR